MRSAGAALAAAAMIASCAPPPAPPAPIPPPLPAAPPPAQAPPPAPAADWRDAPLTPGDWSLTGSSDTPSAIYETSAGAAFQITCSRPGQIGLSVPDAQGIALIVRTTFGERTLATTALAAIDPLFDQMAFSRGRFLVRAPGVEDRILPTWPEPARVIEECRGP
jgi:hypothetical protein